MDVFSQSETMQGAGEKRTDFDPVRAHTCNSQSDGNARARDGKK
jgi:hypothetical protein